MRSVRRGRVGRRGSAVARDEEPGLLLLQELLRVDVGERRDPETGFADQLREDSAGPERDERAERRVLDDAREELECRPRPSAGR